MSIKDIAPNFRPAVHSTTTGEPIPGWEVIEKAKISEALFEDLLDQCKPNSLPYNGVLYDPPTNSLVPIHDYFRRPEFYERRKNDNL